MGFPTKKNRTMKWNNNYIKLTGRRKLVLNILKSFRISRDNEYCKEEMQSNKIEMIICELCGDVCYSWLTKLLINLLFFVWNKYLIYLFSWISNLYVYRHVYCNGSQSSSNLTTNITWQYFKNHQKLWKKIMTILCEPKHNFYKASS